MHGKEKGRREPALDTFGTNIPGHERMGRRLFSPVSFTLAGSSRALSSRGSRLGGYRLKQTLKILAKQVYRLHFHADFEAECQLSEFVRPDEADGRLCWLGGNAPGV